LYKSTNTDAEDALPCPAPYLQAPAAARFTCFTGAKVQILTQKTLLDALLRIYKRLLPLALLALLVQKYKY
jgi:hypothetical protein